MLSRLFNYVLSNTTTLIKRFTVTTNTVTIYQGQRVSGNTPGPYEFKALHRLTQTNPKCAGKKYQTVNQDDPEHHIINPHATISEKAVQHSHLAACDVITPADLASFMKQLMEMQGNKTFMKSLGYVNDPMFMAIIKKMKINLNIPNNTIPGEFISVADAEVLLANYKAYFDINAQHMKIQHETNQQNLTDLRAYGRVPADLGMIALKSAALSSVFSVAGEAMLVNGVRPEMADWIIDSLALIYLAIHTQDIKPILATYFFDKAIRRLPEYPQLHVVKNALLLGIYVICSDTPRSWYGALQVSVSMLSAYAANAGVKFLSHCFFAADTQPEQQAPTANDISATQKKNN